MRRLLRVCLPPFFFFNDTATTEIYTLSLHDALPIWPGVLFVEQHGARRQELAQRSRDFGLPAGSRRFRQRYGFAPFRPPTVPRPRLVAPRRVGDLQVPDARQQPLDRRRQVAFHDLHVEQVVPDERVAGADLLQHLRRLRARAQEAVRHGALAEGLDEKPHPLLAQALRGVLEVSHVRGVQRCTLGAGGNDPRHQVQARAARGARILDRALEVVAEALLAAGQAGGAALVSLRVALRHVVQNDLDARLARRARHLGGREVIGILIFDRPESRLARGGEALQKSRFGEERGNVGGESGHRVSIAPKMADAWWIWLVALFAVSFVIGVVAVVAGVGGGVLFVPIVSGFFPFHLDFVRGVGLVFALAGTLAAGPSLLRNRLASLRLAVPLALSGSIASFAGALAGLALPTEVVQTALGATVLAIAIVVWRTGDAAAGNREADARGTILRLRARYEYPAEGAVVDWRTRRTLTGFVAFAGIGFLGGVFGLGAGCANVPVLNFVMAAPLKVAVGTSGLIISIVNSSAAWVYIHRGALLPALAVPAILGVMLGSRLGASLLARTPASVVRRVVIAVLLLAGARSLGRGTGLWP